MNRSGRYPRAAILALGLALAAARPASALDGDAFRLGLRFLGTGLFAVTAEWLVADNGFCLELGVFDWITEPQLVVSYRRYLRFGDGPVPLMPYLTAGCLVMGAIGAPPGDAPPVWLGFVGGAGLDWNFAATWSLDLQLAAFISVYPEFMPGFAPSLGVKKGL